MGKREGLLGTAIKLGTLIRKITLRGVLFLMFSRLELTVVVVFREIPGLSYAEFSPASLRSTRSIPCQVGTIVALLHQPEFAPRLNLFGGWGCQFL